MLTNLLEL